MSLREKIVASPAVCKCTVDVACIEDWYEHQSIARITHAIEEKENKVFSNEYVTIFFRDDVLGP